MILLIASAEISVKTVTQNKFIRLNINWYEKWNYSQTIVFCLFIFSFFSYSQIKGKCIDENGKGIPYVNISVKGKAIGTVSNLEGTFLWKCICIRKWLFNFSHLNFEKTIGIPLKDQIQLNAKVENLKNCFE
jgi:hypothetical protein